MTVTVDARAQATAGADRTGGRRVPTVRHGQGQPASTARLETAVVGIPGLPTDDPDGTPEPGRQHHRRAVPPHPLTAVVGRQWQGWDEGPGGQTVFLTTASVAKPRQPVDDDDDRRLIEHGWSKATPPPGDWGPPPQTSARAVRVPVRLTLRRFALAMASRRPGAREALGGRPSAGNAGGARSARRPATRCSCWPKGPLASFLAPKTRGSWECSATLCHLQSAAARRSWPRLSSQLGVNCYVGTSAHPLKQLTPQ